MRNKVYQTTQKIMTNIKQCLVYNKLGAQLIILCFFKSIIWFIYSQLFFFFSVFCWKLHSKTEKLPVLHLTWKQNYLICSPCEITSCIDCLNNLSKHRLLHIFPSLTSLAHLIIIDKWNIRIKYNLAEFLLPIFFQYNFLCSHHYLHNIRRRPSLHEPWLIFV